MNTTSRSATILGFLLASCAEAQVHLILGGPNTLSPIQREAATAEVLADGTLAVRETLVDPSRGRGLFWIDVDYDLAQAYLLDDHYGAVVLDLNTGSVVKRCDIPPTKGLGGVWEWRIVDPVLGSAFALVRGAGKVENSILVGLLADPALSCSESTVALRDEQLTAYATGGQAGVGGEAAQAVFFGNISRGRFRTKISKDWIYFPIDLEPSAAKELSPDANYSAPTSIAVRNSSIESVCATAVATLSDCFWARARQGGGQWVRLPIPNGHAPNVRGFGSYLAWPESILGGAGYESTKLDKDTSTRLKSLKSAGSEEWRKGDSKWGRSTEFALTHSSTVHPGILHIFDVKTQQHFTIQTNQADSEVLLIEANTIYYRSSDRLFRVEIRGDHLAARQQIAKSDLIRDAHWAFMTSPTAGRPQP